MGSTVEQIKERLSIEDVISSYLTLERRGGNLCAKCPFHSEKTPSFFVSPARGSYYCFGCGAKGDIFTFVEQFEGLDFKGSLKLLADRAGVTLTYESRDDKDEREELYKVMEAATLFYEKKLSENEAARKYLGERGVTEKTQKEFRIGFAPEDWRELLAHLRAKNYKDTIIETAGLIKKSGGSTYDRFRGRIIFPLFDSSGRVIAFSGRILKDDPEVAKYLNSPDTPLFDKGSTLYGIDRAKDAIRKLGYIVLVEGQFDLVLAHQAGFKNTLATSGTALSESEVSGNGGLSNVGLLGRFAKNVVLAFDADKAGQKATLRVSKIALSLGIDVKVLTLPTGKDPADTIRENKDLWRDALKTTKPVVQYITGKIIESTPESVQQARRIREFVLPVIASMKSSIEQVAEIRIVSKATGIPEYALQKDLEDFFKTKKVEIVSRDPHKPVFTIADRLYGIIFWQEGVTSPLVDVEKLRNEINQIVGQESEEFQARALEKKEELIFEAEYNYHDATLLEKDVKHFLSQLKEVMLRKRLQSLQKSIKDHEYEETKLKQLLEEHRALSYELEELIRKRSHDLHY